MLKTNYPCDLHSHSTRSDGADTPKELIENAVNHGMYALGLTDHDTPPPEKIDGMDAVEYAIQRGLILVPGYEFSCDTNLDDVHICGYRLDWKHPRLEEEIEAAKSSKSNAYRELCDILTRAGYALDWERDILENVPGKSPEAVQRKHVFEAMARRGYTPTWSDAKLLVRDTPAFNNKRRKLDPFDAISLIHTCGGIAVLAHPYLIDETIRIPGRPGTRHEFILQLFEAGLDGIEACYPYDKTTYKGTQTPTEIEAEVRHRYGMCAKFFSGGSDYHADHKKNATKVRSLGECGLTVEEFLLTSLALHFHNDSLEIGRKHKALS